MNTNLNNVVEVDGVYYYNKRPTICWSCKKATGFCSWSDGSFTPVPGWIATYSPIKGPYSAYKDSYIVHECPLYEKG